jgi:integrase
LISDMPRPRPPHLHRERTRHGALVWYVRVGKGPRIRINEEFGTGAFGAAYQAALNGERPAQRGRAKFDSLAWLVDRYRSSSTWASLAKATQRQRANILHNVLKTAADAPYTVITKAKIIEGRERRKSTPSQANNFLNTMRALFDWAVENEFVDVNPVEGVKGLKRPHSGGFHAWTEEEIDRFEERWPLGTRERLAFAILLYTGLRRGDAARIGRQHVTDGVIMLKAEKTGTQLTIPILPPLAEAISATKTGDLAFVATASGTPITKESFGNWFRDACNAAGVPGSAHGLRKAGATRAANNGATVAQLEAIFGWHGGDMASLYTKSADRIRLACDAITKLQKNETGNSIPAPGLKVRAVGQKNQ